MQGECNYCSVILISVNHLEYAVLYHRLFHFHSCIFNSLNAFQTLLLATLSIH